MKFINELPLAALHLDEKTRIINVNSHAKLLFKWQDIPAKRPLFTEFISDEDISSFHSFYRDIKPKVPAIFNTTLNFPANSKAQITIKASRANCGDMLFLLNIEDSWTTSREDSCLHNTILEAQYQHNPGGILLVNQKMEMLSFNQEFVNIWKIPPEVQKSRDEQANLQSVLDKLQDPEGFITKVQYLYDNIHEISTDEVQLIDGRTLYRHTYPIYHHESYLGRVWYFLDITQLKNAQLKIEKQQIFENTILEHVQNGIIACDEKGKIILFNRACRDFYGIENNSPTPGTLAELKHYQPDGFTSILPSEEPLTKALSGQCLQNDEIVIVDHETTPHTFRVNGQAMIDCDGKQIGAVISLHDITDLRTAKEKLRFMAYHDELTGLPNRRLFHDLLQQSLKHALRDQLFVGVLFLDMDNFKSVNDLYGHDIGDELLKELSVTLKQCLRASDILCRWGGDEFVICLPSGKDPQDIVKVAEKICETVIQYTHHENKDIDVSISIGIAISPSHGNEPDLLIRNADMAMYRAKKLGKNRCELFLPNNDI